MKTKNQLFVLLSCLFFLGCNNDIPENNNTDGFWIKVGEKIVPTSEIDYNK